MTHTSIGMLSGGTAPGAIQHMAAQASWALEHTSAGEPAALHHTVDARPWDAMKRRVARWGGIGVEVLHVTRPGKVLVQFEAPVHLLVAHEQGARQDGETVIEGLPGSRLKELKHKLTFVPAGHRYAEWHDTRVLPQITYFYLDPAHVAARATGFQSGTLAPRLFFEDRVIWETAVKLKAAVEMLQLADCLYLDALGAVLIHELARSAGGMRQAGRATQGGLAAWQQRVVLDYIEEHLAEFLSLSELAALVRLSPQHFCRAFKQSLGQPPGRYHAGRRVERAKLLLADMAKPMTEIGLMLGFSESSSFTTAFRRATGLTPTAYRRSLV